MNLLIEALNKKHPNYHIVCERSGIMFHILIFTPPKVYEKNKVADYYVNRKVTATALKNGIEGIIAKVDKDNDFAIKHNLK